MPRTPRLVFYAPQQLCDDMRRLDLARKDVAQVLGVAVKTVDAYKAGRRRMPLAAAQRWQSFTQQRGAA